MNCNEAVAALIASLENGTPMTEEQRTHIHDCERCRELLDSAKQFQTLLDGNGIQAPAVDATLAAAEAEVRRNRMRRVVKFAIGGVVLLAAGITALRIGAAETAAGRAVFVVGAGIAIGALVATPILLLLSVVRGANGEGKRRFYKRLGSGRMLSGVSLGIAEATGADVRLIRLALLALLFADGVGFWLYVLLALAMPVHPDDRQYLLRFRLRRWWQRKFAHAEHHAR